MRHFQKHKLRVTRFFLVGPLSGQSKATAFLVAKRGTVRGVGIEQLLPARPDQVEGRPPAEQRGRMGSALLAGARPVMLLELQGLCVGDETARRSLLCIKSSTCV